MPNILPRLRFSKECRDGFRTNTTLYLFIQKTCLGDDGDGIVASSVGGGGGGWLAARSTLPPPDEAGAAAGRSKEVTFEGLIGRRRLHRNPKLTRLMDAEFLGDKEEWLETKTNRLL